MRWICFDFSCWCTYTQAQSHALRMHKLHKLHLPTRFNEYTLYAPPPSPTQIWVIRMCEWFFTHFSVWKTRRKTTATKKKSQKFNSPKAVRLRVMCINNLNENEKKREKKKHSVKQIHTHIFLYYISKYRKNFPLLQTNKKRNGQKGNEETCSVRSKLNNKNCYKIIFQREILLLRSEQASTRACERARKREKEREKKNTYANKTNEMT